LRLLSAGAWGLALCVACGRIGYEDLPETPSDAGSPVSRVDGGGDRTTPPPPIDASMGDVAADAPAEARGVGGDDEGSIEAAVEATSDASEGGPDSGDASEGGGCSVDAAVSDYCAAIPFLPQPPVIDGVVDCGLPLIDFIPVGWTGGATPPDATAQYAVAWRPDGIYFFVQVHDPSHVPAEPTEFTWQGDAVELFADSDGQYAAPPAYDIPGTAQFVIGAPPDAQSSVATGEIWTNTPVDTVWTSTQFRAYGTADGYVVEAFVTGPDLGLATLALASGGHVGTDLSVDVSYPSDQGPDAGATGAGNRVGQYFLNVASPDAGGGIPPFDPRAFCVPVLSGV
jgi:hypothetical protein